MARSTQSTDRYVVTSDSEKRRVRLRLGKSKPEILKIPYLLSTQLDSYAQFLQAGVDPEKRQQTGLHAAFSSVFPITNPTQIFFFSESNF